MNNLIVLNNALEVGKVCKTAEAVHVCIRNRGQWNGYNHIEIFNTGEHLVKNVTIRIMDLPNDDGWWENPGNSDKQVLIISYLEPRNYTEQKLTYAYCGVEADVQFQLTWEDYFGIKHCDTELLHLEGM